MESKWITGLPKKTKLELTLNSIRKVLHDSKSLHEKAARVQTAILIASKLSNKKAMK